jgi:outer membrane putative beta-barrel porin/alpha-amylase
MALRTVLVWLGLSALCGSAAASCGSAFCVLNTMWGTQGVPVEPGAARVDMRFEYINQNQLRSGTRRISQAEDTADTTELRTINRNLQTTFDYALSKSWALSAAMPIIDRAHSHIADPTGAATPEQWNFTRIGDLRLLGLYSFDNQATPFVNSGLTFGVKLPTGDYRVRNADGTTAERALQPGTGSTDAIAGAFYAAPGFGEDSSWWIQGLVQQAIQTRDDFRPGTQLQLNLGYRHPLTESLQGLLQLNTLVKARDSGANAEPDLSGSKSVFLSPGLSYALTHEVQVYGFLQLPLYRYVNGIQLSADYAVVLGITTKF